MDSDDVVIGNAPRITGFQLMLGALGCPYLPPVKRKAVERELPPGEAPDELRKPLLIGRRGKGTKKQRKGKRR